MNPQLFQIVFDQVYGDKRGHAFLLHRDSVEPVSREHRASSVGGDDKLGMFCQFVQIFRIAVDVGIVKRRLDLIKETERGRF